MGLSSRRKVFFIFLACCLFFFSFCVYSFLRPSSATLSAKTIYIRRGTPLWKISETLEEESIIRNRYFFSAVAIVLGKRSGIKAGEYELHTRMLPLEVLDALITGQVRRHLVTLAEGCTLSQVAQLLQDSDIVEKKTFLEKARSPALISSLGLSESAGATLEGYLFPETYYLTREMDPEEVIRVMVHQFKKVFSPDLENRAAQIGLSPKEALTLASIVEKETPLPSEKPLISAVYHNRLKKRMPLQSDPTVIYGIENFNGNLTKEDLLRPTPYNTYVIQGLPPSPICNPGKDSILAALYPASVPYLYFVSKNDGSHYFSFDLEEHDRAVWKYQKWSRKNHLTKK